MQRSDLMKNAAGTYSHTFRINVAAIKEATAGNEREIPSCRCEELLTEAPAVKLPLMA